MSDDDRTRAAPERVPCRKCMVIRFFLMAVVTLALVQVLSPSTFRVAAGMSTLQMALLFLGILAIAATGKVVAKHFAAPTDRKP